LSLPGNVLKYWAGASIIANTTRLGLVLTRKEPWGDLSAELFYALFKTLPRTIIKKMRKHQVESLLEG